jgi:hypothetical protein
MFNLATAASAPPRQVKTTWATPGCVKFTEREPLAGNSPDHAPLAEQESADTAFQLRVATLPTLTFAGVAFNAMLTVPLRAAPIRDESEAIS